jgi:hypothetical protein
VGRFAHPKLAGGVEFERFVVTWLKRKELLLFGLTWEIVYGWAGYDFWGVLLGVISAFFAIRANRNAKHATAAATNAVQTVSSVEAVAELGKLLRVLKEIRWRLEKLEWDRVSEYCAEVQAIVATLQSSSNVALSEEGGKSLQGMAGQMAWLAKLADKAFHEEAAIDHVKVKNMLSKSTVKATTLQVELKEKAAEQ